MQIHDSNKKIAVIGAGVAGLTAAYLLSKKFNVVLFEKNHYCGGHANTVTIPHGADAGTPVDTGFIVFNKQNYPTFLALLKTLDVAYKPSDMSFSYFSKNPYFMYSSDVPRGLFGLKRHWISPRFYHLISEILRFNKQASLDIETNATLPETLGEYLTHHRFSEKLIQCYVIPMGAAIWSASFDETMAMPAYTFLHFWRNHGLLQTLNRPSWYTIEGGSRTYVNAIKQKLNSISVNNAAKRIFRYDNGVKIVTEDNQECFCDYVVIATHANEALALLDAPSADESRLLGQWSYSQNHTVFHTDPAQLPPRKQCWASWNYLQDSHDADAPVSVSYLMNRLQGINSKTPYIVTLNPQTDIPDPYIIRTFNYTHPCFNTASIATQKELPSLNNKNHTFFCGSYFKYGFHEDAAWAGAEVAKHFGIYL
jgi:predicted NAD/FAD-binding protein